MVLREEKRGEGKELRTGRVESEREEALSLLLLLLEIAGIIIAIIAVCTKRTFSHHLLCGDANGSLSLSNFFLPFFGCFNMTKLPKTYYVVSFLFEST